MARNISRSRCCMQLVSAWEREMLAEGGVGEIGGVEKGAGDF